MLPHATELFIPFVFGLSIIAIIYTSLVALVQQDMKKMIAYSSVAHMGFVTLGIFTLTIQGVEGAIFQMISHGIISAALFLCVGVVYDRLHTRDINHYGGLAKTMPFYATVFMVMMLGAVGLPGTSGFVGEFLVLLGTFRVDPVVATFAASGVVLGATYMLLLYRKVIFFQPVVRQDEADYEAGQNKNFQPGSKPVDDRHPAQNTGWSPVRLSDHSNCRNECSNDGNGYEAQLPVPFKRAKHQQQQSADCQEYFRI